MAWLSDRPKGVQRECKCASGMSVKVNTRSLKVCHKQSRMQRATFERTSRLTNKYKIGMTNIDKATASTKSWRRRLPAMSDWNNKWLERGIERPIKFWHYGALTFILQRIFQSKWFEDHHYYCDCVQTLTGVFKSQKAK